MTLVHKANGVALERSVVEASEELHGFMSGAHRKAWRGVLLRLPSSACRVVLGPRGPGSSFIDILLVLLVLVLKRFFLIIVSSGFGKP